MRVVEEQILIRGPVLMERYRLRPDLTAQVLKDGWLHTADAGRFTEGGRVEVLGRIDDVILTGGEKVSPAEVEQALLAHPEVADAAVGAVPDPEWGQAVAVLVVPSGAAAPTPADLKSFLAERLAPYKRPKLVLAVDRIPRTESGKIRRAAVREMLQQRKEP